MSVTHQTPWMCGCACNTFLKVFLYYKVWDGGVGSTWMFVWWKHDYACTAFFELSKFSYHLMLFPSFQPCTITATRVCMCMTLCSLPTNKTIEHVVFLGAPSFFLSRFQEHKRQLLGLKRVTNHRSFVFTSVFFAPYLTISSTWAWS